MSSKINDDRFVVFFWWLFLRKSIHLQTRCVYKIRRLTLLHKKLLSDSYSKWSLPFQMQHTELLKRSLFLGSGINLGSNITGKVIFNTNVLAFFKIRKLNPRSIIVQVHFVFRKRAKTHEISGNYLRDPGWHLAFLKRYIDNT